MKTKVYVVLKTISYDIDNENTQCVCVMSNRHEANEYVAKMNAKANSPYATIYSVEEWEMDSLFDREE